MPQVTNTSGSSASSQFPKSAYGYGSGNVLHVSRIMILSCNSFCDCCDFRVYSRLQQSFRLADAQGLVIGHFM